MYNVLIFTDNSLFTMHELWSNLMALIDGDKFFYVDREAHGSTFRIFLYRLASYTDFLQPAALESRGIMFQIDDFEQPVRIASRPMSKFFNLNENPMTMDIDLWDVETVMDKADGSLISSYTVDGTVHLKTKGALFSDQAVAAEKLMYSAQYAELYNAVLYLEREGWTVNMEYCAPDNRIVIGYEEPQLIVLNVRNRETGLYFQNHLLDTFFVSKNLIYTYTPFEHGDHMEGRSEKEVMVDFLEGIPSATGIEGVVAILRNGQWIKIKTEAYLTAHRAKDSINIPRRLYEAVLEEATDDLRSLFYDDPLALKLIEEMEQKVEKLFAHVVHTVQSFYETNKNLERKDYAILGQKELDRRYFGLAMSLWLGKDVNYKEFLRKHWKDFGIKDDPVVLEE